LKLGVQRRGASKKQAKETPKTNFTGIKPKMGRSQIYEHECRVKQATKIMDTKTIKLQNLQEYQENLTAAISK